jgi:retron-type reverse transcriptase
MSCKKSCGPDELPISIFKNHGQLLSKPLQYLFNLSLKQGIVPTSLKIAKVIPIFKKGDRSLMSNYRPISLLNTISKILEKIIDSRVRNFLDKYNLIYDYQFGFRQHHSTSLAVLEVIDECYKKLDSDYYAVGIYFDLQKAFDTVNHEILLKKLYHYGIRGNLHKWFASYLANRTQFTYVNNTASDVFSIECGVPQGSVLGPLLFIIYVNDLPNAVHKCVAG